MSHSPPHITENVLLTIRFAHYHVLLASNSTFMADSQYLNTIQIRLNLNEHQYHLTSTKSKIRQIDANCSPLQSQDILPFQSG